MDKPAWIAVILCVIGLFAWQYYFNKAYPLPATPPATAAASPSPGASPVITAFKPETLVDRKEAGPAPAETAAEQIETVVTPQIELHFTNLGGGIKEVIPLGKQHLAENGVNIKLNHAGEIPIGAISGQPGRDARLPYTLSRQGNVVRCERTEPDGLKIVKEYSLDWQGDSRQIPAIQLKVSFTNTAAQPYQNGGYYVYAGSAAPIHERDVPSYLSFDWMSEGHFHTDHATSFDEGRIPIINSRAARDVITNAVGRASWVAVKNQFYATVLAPLPSTPGEEPAAREVWSRRFDLTRSEEDIANNHPVRHGLDVALGLPALQLAPGQTVTEGFQIYAGPKFYSRLDKLGHNEQELMDFGKFKIVSIALLALMNTFNHWFGSYAVAIILLTILVKGVLFPLQNKANKSMKRMSLLAPLQAELREKYKDDPARLQQETMKLYKQYGVSPVGGCLPMLVQMPIFFGFLYMLYTAAELRNASFLWVHDLSQPDTVAHFMGYPINVLPLFMIGTQFWQMSLTPKTGDASQQKTMMFMPLLFGFFTYSFAAALALYYTMQGLLTILQLYLTRNQTPPTLEAGGAKPVAARGGGFGGFGGFGGRGFGSGSSSGGGRKSSPRRLKT